MTKRILSIGLLLVFLLAGASAFAFTVRCYNEDGKTYRGLFVCKGNIKVAVEISAGTTTLSTQNDGPCDLRVGDSVVTVVEGDSVGVKGGEVSKR